MLEDLKNALRDLEAVRSLDLQNPDLVELKRTLRDKIAEVESVKMAATRRGIG